MRVASILFLGTTAAGLPPSLSADANVSVRRHLSRGNMVTNSSDDPEAKDRHIKNILLGPKVYEPHSHGKSEGDTDDGYVIGHGNIDGLNRDGGGKPRSTKGSLNRAPRGSPGHTVLGGSDTTAAATEEAKQDTLPYYSGNKSSEGTPSSAGSGSSAKTSAVEEAKHDSVSHKSGAKERKPCVPSRRSAVRILLWFSIVPR